MSLSANGMRTAMRQIQEIRANPIDGLVLRPTENLAEVEADLAGPVDTPFQGGMFHIVLQLGEGFPEAPPKGYFRTRIFHPNVSEKGEICVNSLKKDWDASLGLRHVLTVIRCLLIEPNPESALNEEAGRLLLEHYDEYAKRARMMTAVHAGGAAAAEAANTNALREASSSVANTISPNASQQIGDMKSTIAAPSASAAAGGENDAAAAAAQKKAAADKKKAALKRL